MPLNNHSIPSNPLRPLSLFIIPLEEQPPTRGVAVANSRWTLGDRKLPRRELKLDVSGGLMRMSRGETRLRSQDYSSWPRGRNFSKLSTVVWNSCRNFGSVVGG